MMMMMMMTDRVTMRAMHWLCLVMTPEQIKRAICSFTYLFDDSVSL